MVVAEREGDRSSEVLSGSEGRSLFSICAWFCSLVCCRCFLFSLCLMNLSSS